MLIVAAVYAGISLFLAALCGFDLYGRGYDARICIEHGIATGILWPVLLLVGALIRLVYALELGLNRLSRWIERR